MAKKHYLQVLSPCQCYYSCLLLFYFYWKTNMHTVRVCIIVVCNHNLKLKIFHILVEYIRDLLFCVNIFNHALKNEIKHSGDVFREISIIFSCVN